MYIAELKPIVGRGELCRFLSKFPLGYKCGVLKDEWNEEDINEAWKNIEDITQDKIESVRPCKNLNSEIIYIVYTEKKARMFVCSSDNELLKKVLAGYEIINFYRK